MVLQLLRFSVLVSLVGLPLTLEARAIEERPQVFVSVFNNAGVDNATVLVAEKLASKIYTSRSVDYLENCLARPNLETCMQRVDNPPFSAAH